MANKSEAASKVITFPKETEAERGPSSTQRIWGTAVLGHGFTSIPSILIQAQTRLGITPLQMNIIVQLLDYWHDPQRKPFPTKRQIGERIGVNEKTIQNNIRALETAGLVRRQQRKTASGDWNSNIYHLDGLVAKVQKMEPDFTKAREERREAKRSAELPVGQRLVRNKTKLRTKR